MPGEVVAGGQARGYCLLQTLAQSAVSWQFLAQICLYR
jgi:hypothetical protein